MQAATEQLSDEETAALYDRFVKAREATIIEEIRRVCGLTALPAPASGEAEEDEVAADVEADLAPTNGAAVVGVHF